MDELTFSARRIGATSPPRPPAATADLDVRFRTLVQSPLRAGILRYLSARPEESPGPEEAKTPTRVSHMEAR